MDVYLENMDLTHKKSVMDIFNYYINSSTAAFSDEELPEEFYFMLLEKAEGYPAYVVKDGDSVIGFCLLAAYSPYNTFKETAKITYFISEKYTGKGIGYLCLKRLEEDAQSLGIHNLIAEISSENNISINFHKKHGFHVVGETKNIGCKLNTFFGIVCMQKTI